MKEVGQNFAKRRVSQRKDIINKDKDWGSDKREIERKEEIKRKKKLFELIGLWV